MMTMLTNYDYTIDVTSDADGAVETWGTKAGHGIISDQVLYWVKKNCQEACPGEREGTEWLRCLEHASRTEGAPYLL